MDFVETIDFIGSSIYANARSHTRVSFPCKTGVYKLWICELSETDQRSESTQYFVFSDRLSPNKALGPGSSGLKSKEYLDIDR